MRTSVANLKMKQKLRGFPENKYSNGRKVLICKLHKKLLKLIRKKAKSIRQSRFEPCWSFSIYIAKSYSKH